jgi:hypothetical protein
MTTMTRNEARENFALYFAAVKENDQMAVLWHWPGVLDTLADGVLIDLPPMLAEMLSRDAAEVLHPTIKVLQMLPTLGSDPDKALRILAAVLEVWEERGRRLIEHWEGEGRIIPIDAAGA